MLQISNLKENMVYQFQVAAMNIAGLGAPSAVSTSFKCEEWTIAVPGKPGRPCLSTEAQSFFQWNLQPGTKFKWYIYTASKGDKFSQPLVFTLNISTVLWNNRYQYKTEYKFLIFQINPRVPIAQPLHGVGWTEAHSLNATWLFKRNSNLCLSSSRPLKGIQFTSASKIS